MSTTVFETPELLLGADVRIWEGMSKVIQDNFHCRGAVGVKVTAFSKLSSLSAKSVMLDSEVFQSVILNLEQVNLILCHLLPSSNTEMVFVMAQAVAEGFDIDMVYDMATGQLKTPHAERKGFEL